MKKFVGILTACIIVVGMILIYKNITKNEEMETVVEGATEIGTKYKEYEEVKCDENEHIVYNAFNIAIGIYKSIYGNFERVYTESNQTVMSFDENVENNVYISNTNDNKNGSQCYNINDNKVKSIYKSEKNVCLLPLCTNGIDFYYVYEKYTDGLGDGNRTIVKIENGNKIDILKTNNVQIYDGAIIESVIYYTAYVDDKDAYDMYSFNLNTSEHRLEKEGLVDGTIYAYKNQVVYSDKAKVYTDIKTWNLGAELSDIKIVEDEDILLGYNITRDGDLELQVYDMNESKVIDRIENIITYKIEDSNLIIYSLGEKGIVNYNLKTMSNKAR